MPLAIFLVTMMGFGRPEFPGRPTWDDFGPLSGMAGRAVVGGLALEGAASARATAQAEACFL